MHLRQQLSRETPVSRVTTDMYIQRFQVIYYQLKALKRYDMRPNPPIMPRVYLLLKSKTQTMFFRDRNGIHVIGGDDTTTYVHDKMDQLSKSEKIIKYRPDQTKYALATNTTPQYDWDSQNNALHCFPGT